MKTNAEPNGKVGTADRLTQSRRESPLRGWEESHIHGLFSTRLLGAADVAACERVYSFSTKSMLMTAPTMSIRTGLSKGTWSEICRM